MAGEVYIAIWTHHPGDLLGEAIDFLTHAPKGGAQHAGFIRGNGKVHELYLPQLRDRDIVDSEKQFVRRFRIENATPEIDAAFETKFDSNLKKHIVYGLEDLFKIELNIPFPDDKTMVCSTYVFSTVNAVAPKSQLQMRMEEWEATPRDILISPRLQEVYWS